MSPDAGGEQAQQPAHRITWFAPDRPVEGTVFVRPLEPDLASECIIAASDSDA